MCQYINWLEHTPAKVQAEGELTTAEWLNVVNQTGPLSLITFTGGEVFVRRDFMDIFEHASTKRRTHFISNATMLTEERAKRCVELAPGHLGGRGFNFVGISIDGTRDVHDVIRAQPGAFDKTVRGVKLLADYRREMGKRCPIIHISTVIQNNNLEVLPDVPGLAAESGANVLNLLTEMRSMDIQNIGYAYPGTFGPGDFRMPRIDPARLEETLLKTRRAAQKAGIELRLPRTTHAELIRYYNGGYDLANYECRAVWTNVYVGSKGDVFPCFICKVGNIREQSLKEIWNSPAMREFRRRRRDAGFAVCQGCCELELRGKAVQNSRNASNRSETVSAS
jgi:radical SAM protein with 4Fe4S-binding SPASM domain